MVTVPQINITELNRSLTSLSNRVNFDIIQTSATDATNQLQAATTTSLGVNVNDIIGGWQGLTAEVDNVDITSVANRGIALLQANPPGVNLVNTFDAGAQTALQSITGLSSEITEGLNVVAAALPTAEGVGAALENLSDKNLDELQSAMQSVAPQALQSLAPSSAIKQLRNSGIFNDFSSTVTAVTSSFQSYLNQGFGQTIKDLIEADTQPVRFAITQLTQDTGLRVPENVHRQIASLVDQGRFLEAARILEPFSNLDVTTLETELSEISTAASDLINQFSPETAAFGTSTAPIVSLGQQDSRWDGANTAVCQPGSTGSGLNAGGGSTSNIQFAFTTVGSMEELEAEIRGASREITETVIHWTGNYIDQAHIGAEEVHAWHLQRGFSGCGYHYIIKRDGSIQRGRPINIRGAHVEGNLGHNTLSIGISHVAGYNCTSGTPNPNRYISAESINEAQWRAQRNFLEVFYRVFPGGQVLGHNQISQNNKVDPGFDVDAYILNTFGKRNVYIYNSTTPPLSRADLVAARGATS